MNKVGYAVYWLGCGYVLSHLFLMHDWVQFFDGFSLLCTLVPAVAALAIAGEGITQRFKLSAKIMWVSATLTFVYGAVLTLSHYPFDADGFVMGLSVAMLPLFYALILTLLVAPLVFRTEGNNQ